MNKKIVKIFSRFDSISQVKMPMRNLRLPKRVINKFNEKKKGRVFLRYLFSSFMPSSIDITGSIWVELYSK
jgi:hypothetical protein